MFTGIVQEVGTVTGAERVGGGLELTIRAPHVSNEINTGDSICINGVCLTAVKCEKEHVTVVSVEETLLKTNLAGLLPSSRTNLELAMQLGDRLGGHLVSGHVDCVGAINSINRRETSWLFGVSIPEQFQRYVISVGSIAIDGVSLTVAAIEGTSVVVSIIPHTMDNTIFTTYSVDTRVNLEFDIIGKYVERLLNLGGDGINKGTISKERLQQWGYKL